MYTLRARRVLGEWMEQFKEASMERIIEKDTCKGEALVTLMTGKECYKIYYLIHFFVPAD